MELDGLEARRGARAVHGDRAGFGGVGCGNTLITSELLKFIFKSGG